MSHRLTFVFDLDGTLTDCEWRRHLAEERRWDEFFEQCGWDAPMGHIVAVARALAAAGHRIVYVTGRPRRVERKTVQWIIEHGLPSGGLFMRGDGDHRPDHVIKAETAKRIVETVGPIAMAFDDRSTVVAMWRNSGIPCAQVAPGDF